MQTTDDRGNSFQVDLRFTAKLVTGTTVSNKAPETGNQ